MQVKWIRNQKEFMQQLDKKSDFIIRLNKGFSTRYTISIENGMYVVKSHCDGSVKIVKDINTLSETCCNFSKAIEQNSLGLIQ